MNQSKVLSNLVSLVEKNVKIEFTSTMNLTAFFLKFGRNSNQGPAKLGDSIGVLG